MEGNILEVALVLLTLGAPLIMQFAKWLSKYPLSAWLPEVQGTLAEVSFGVLAGGFGLLWVWLRGELIFSGNTPMEWLGNAALVGAAVWAYGTAVYAKFKQYMPGPKNT